MLSQLTIENFGLIDRVAMDFTSHLNILTGETGAGKSIIIDALHFVLGERFKSAQIRDPQNPCFVEGVFDLSQTRLMQLEIFKEFFPNDTEETTFIIQRQAASDGKGKIKINGLSVTLAQLKAIGDHLVDFHGPHDHQLLFADGYHIQLLDQLANFGDLQDKFREQYREYTRLQRRQEELQNMSASRTRDIELLDHQITELEQVPLDPKPFEELSQKQLRINNLQKLFECASSLLEFLDNQEMSLSEIIRMAFGPMKTLNQIDNQTLTLTEHLTNIQENSRQLISELKDYLERLSFQPDEAAEIHRKIEIYDAIQRKYGPTIEDAKNFYTQAKEKYDLLANLAYNAGELDEKIKQSRKILKEIADQLTKIRKKAALLLKQTIEKELKDLGISHVTFEARISPTEFHETGQDKIVFFISPNAGEDLKPLSEIVSSGEAARVMLALKKALTKVDPIPVLIFDEIDAQIGGRLGTITGNKLKELSRDRQVILITHLPQIACFAEQHFKVIKAVTKGRTSTQVIRLDQPAQVQELAQMMGGKKHSQISVDHAEDLLAQAKNI